jgi:hypothetical protein
MSMNIQQYALTSPDIKEADKRYRLWLGGLALYCIAQIICTAALSFSPLSLVAALFTTMLIFDALIGRFLVTQKPLRLPALVGLAMIFVSVVLVAAVGPKEEYAITAECLVYWAKASQGTAAISSLAIIFLANFSIYRWFTKKYPHFREVDHATGEMQDVVPNWLFLTMQIVFPACLAVTETVGSLALKALSSMVRNGLSSKEGAADLLTPEFLFLVMIYVGSVIMIITWLRIVYSKWATAECLGAEYGMVAVFSIVSSLLYYQEHKDPNINLPLIAMAVLGIVIGICILVVGETYMGGYTVNRAEQVSRGPVSQCGD